MNTSYLQPGTDIGRYHILEKLGEGGMAVVYKAYDVRLENDVAIKFIRTGEIGASILPRILKRFQIEAKKMAALIHPNIVKVMDFGDYEGTPYLVMPFYAGGTLKSRLGQPMPYQEVVRLLLPVIDALQYAHEQGLIHRDVKPSNILMTPSGQSMLSDFGVAKVLEGEETLDLTVTGMGVGTPEYMAPEQAEGKAIDARADIYALGVVLYELLTGRKPFTADTPMAVLIKHARDPLPRPTQYTPDLPEEVEQILFKALAKQPGDRYQSMAEMGAALSSKERSVPAWEQAVKRQSRPEVVQPSPVPSQQPIQDIPKKRKNLPIWVFGVVGALAMVVIFLIYRLNQPPDTQEANTASSKAIPSLMAADDQTGEVINSQVSPVDGMAMVFIPAGNFSMGSNGFSYDQKPEHTIFLNDYWIDQTEVTNRQYQLCVDAGDCKPPAYYPSHTRSNYYLDPEYKDFPVINVSWYQANDYCEWAGRRLPTESEWEKAARGLDGRVFPWGNLSPNENLLNFNSVIGDTNKVGSYPEGISPYGVFDMAGNVDEWVFDWYGANYYSESQLRNPYGPLSGKNRVLRGGSWSDSESNVRSTYRLSYEPSSTYDGSGFRCGYSDDQLVTDNLLFKEDFESSTFEGNIPAGWYQWQVILDEDNNSVLSIDMVNSDLYPEQFHFGDSSWKNTIIKFRVKPVQCRSAKGGAALIDLGSKYYLNFSCRHNQLYLNKWNGPNIREINIDVKEGKWYQITIDNSHSQLSIYVNDSKVVDIPEFEEYQGKFGFSTDPDSKSYFDDIEIIQGDGG